MTEFALAPEPAQQTPAIPAPARAPAAHTAPAGIAPRPQPTAQPAPHPDLAALSRAIAAGDERALAALYELWFDRALALAAALTRRTPLRDEATTLDIVQDAFVRVIRSMRPMPTGEDVERWLVRVIKTTALDHLRRESRRAAREQRAGRRLTATPPPAPPVPSAAAELAEQIHWLRARLDALSPEEQALLGLRFAHDRTLDQAGAGAGLSGDAAHGRLRRTLDRLRLSARSVFHERP